MLYFYVGTMLPKLSFDEPPELSFSDFEQLLKDNLTRKDYRQTLVIRRLYDILNIRDFWRGEPLSHYGTLDENELSEGLLNQITFPTYVYDFLDQYETKEERLSHFSAVLAAFFRSEIKKTHGLLHDYLKFERELRLLTVAFRAKKYGRDLSLELQYENPDEPFIAQLLAQKDAKEIELPEKYHKLKAIFENRGHDPLALQKALDELRFCYLEDAVNLSDLFSIKRILAFFLQLLLVEKWNGMKQEKGLEILASFEQRQ